jgi:hypothetical protein
MRNVSSVAREITISAAESPSMSGWIVCGLPINASSVIRVSDRWRLPWSDLRLTLAVEA